MSFDISPPDESPTASAKLSLQWHAVWPALITEVDKSLSYKKQVEDFQVIEQLGFEPSGQGEHLFLWVEKTNLNTEQISGFLCRQFDLHKRDVAYSGMKDKFAHTFQWFCIPWPIKKELPALDEVQGFGWKALKLVRHDRKLKRGVHKANQFHLTLHAENFNANDWALVEKRLENIQAQGFANYFGEQRFGNQGNNLLKAEQLFNREIKLKKPLKSIVLSAARSYLFNEYLSARIQNKHWGSLLEGDLLQIDGSQSYFIDAINDDIQARFNNKQLHAMGPMIGQSNRDLEHFLSSPAAQDFKLLPQIQDWPEKLAAAGLKTVFRALRVVPKSLHFELIDQSSMQLSFELPTGSFATALLSELSASNYMNNMPLGPTVNHK